MSLLTLFIMILIVLLTKDDEVKIVIFVSACVFFSDFLFWLSGSEWYYVRHIIRDLFLALVCLTFKRKDFNWAAIVCLLYVGMMSFEASSPYQTFLTPYVHTIQIVMMQLYLLALTYKSEWKLPCRRQQKM
jgi:hypothetical protein